jgi:hypothetical protein
MASLVMTKPPPSEGGPAAVLAPPELSAPAPFGSFAEVAEQPNSRPNASAGPIRDRRHRLSGERHQVVIELAKGLLP